MDTPSWHWTWPLLKLWFSSWSPRGLVKPRSRPHPPQPWGDLQTCDSVGPGCTWRMCISKSSQLLLEDYRPRESLGTRKNSALLCSKWQLQGYYFFYVLEISGFSKKLYLSNVTRISLYVSALCPKVLLVVIISTEGERTNLFPETRKKLFLLQCVLMGLTCFPLCVCISQSKFVLLVHTAHSCIHNHK